MFICARPLELPRGSWPMILLEPDSSCHKFESTEGLLNMESIENCERGTSYSHCLHCLSYTFRPLSCPLISLHLLMVIDRLQSFPDTLSTTDPFPLHPVLLIELPIHLTCRLASFLSEPSWDEVFAILFPDLPACAL